MLICMTMKKSFKKITRRSFIDKTSTVAAGMTILPGSVIGGFGHMASGDRAISDMPIELVRDRKPCAAIVLPPAKLPVEQHAAMELQKYILKMSGAKLPILRKSDRGKTNIYIGTAAPTEGLDLSESALGFDGYVVVTSGQDIILTGAKPYSCLYAVYHLLERHLGCGFFEDGEQVPVVETIQLTTINYASKPRFSWRAQVNCMQDAYSGIRWWDDAELTNWVDLMAKKRLNIWTTERLADSCGIAALAAAKLGIPIELTAWQKKRITVLRRAFEYARTLGIRIVFMPGDYIAVKENDFKGPGTYPYSDPQQIEEFFRRYMEKTGEKVPMIPYEWCGTTSYIVDPRHPVTQKFVTAQTQAYADAFGTDHLYMLGMPSEGGWKSDDLEEMNRITYSMILKMIAAVKAGDPEATIYSQNPFPYGKTFEAQKRAVRDAGLAVYGDPWLNQPGRLHDFMMCDYYWNLPWTTGMTLTCGTHTNPYGDLQLALRNARELAADPKAARCFGFAVRTEVNRCIVLMQELNYEISWNPAEIEVKDYLHRWTIRRYGSEVAGALQSATENIAATLLSYNNMDLSNRPLYRNFRGSYLPGLTPVSVKRTLSYLPRLRQALETLLSQHDHLHQSMLYRYDVVDYGRTYLGAMFNDRLGRARKALRARDKATFEKNATEIEEIMHFMARYCSAHSRLRLKTYDDWAGQWPEILSGYNNRESNWSTFTALISLKYWNFLLDYMAEDMAELVEYYFWPRVRLYLEEMRKFIDAGKDISGRLTSRNSDHDMLHRVSDWAPPQGKLLWSPYGNTCEPELTAGDDELAYKIISEGSLSGKFHYYEGPVNETLRELLDRYPVPEDLSKILSEPDPEAESRQAQAIDVKVGETIMGFRTPGVVEKVRVPKDLGYLVTVEQLSKEYNLMRGDITIYRVMVSDYLKLTRLPDERATIDYHDVAVFEFEADGKPYILRYDPGTSHTPTGIYIDPR